MAWTDKDDKAWILGGYVSALLGGFFGLLIGCQLHFHCRQLPDGRGVHAYGVIDRVHWLRIMVLAILMLLLLVSVRVAQSLNNN